MVQDVAIRGMGAVKLVAVGWGQLQMNHYGRVDAASSSVYKGCRYPVEVISHRAWLDHQFPLSLREVEEMMMAHGVIVSYETIRAWCTKFGQAFANGLRRRRPRPGDKWHLDEVFITIHGKTHYLWRAVAQDGNVLDILVISRCDARFFRQLLTGLRSVLRVLTDKLASTRSTDRNPFFPSCSSPSSVNATDPTKQP